MKIGISIPNNWGVTDPQDVIGVAVLAEELGYDSVWTAEHMLNVGYLYERIGDQPYYHALATLSYVAAKTSRITLGTSVLVLPFRHPVEFAKYTATLDWLSGGRLILGIGVGGLADEFSALGIPWEKRGAISDECIAVIKALWTQPRASHAGVRWNFSNVGFTPKPLQKPHVPLWVGGASSAAQRRAAVLCDGWHPTGISIEEFTVGAAKVRAQAVAAGRDPGRIVMSMRVNIAIEGSTLTTEVENRSVLPGDDMARLREGIRQWQDAGCEHLILALNTNEIPLLHTTIKKISSEVLRCR